MSLKNSCRLHGFTSKDVEVHTFESGSIKASVSLATNEFYTNAKGEKVEMTNFHNLITFNKTAEIFQKYVTKGKELLVEGRITYRDYEDKDGVKRYITEIVVDEVLLMGGKDK